jgi:NAD(P)-dependent dehydrogenase (short-subunit alcohol dehydrogenase family)
MNLTGKVAIVTGGERGIGRGITERLLREGMRVCIAGIDTNAAASALRELDAGERLIFREMDVRDEESVRGAVAAAVEAFGRLDALIANAGIAKTGNTPVEETSLDYWNNLIATNLTGPFLCAKHAFPELRKTRGAMVLIASTRGLQSQPNSPAYAASKGGVIALTHNLAMSASPDIRVNCISPGWIHLGDRARLKPEQHATHPAGRVGMPADIAAMAAFLISDDAGFITAENFVVDGGMTKKMTYR